MPNDLYFVHGFFGLQKSIDFFVKEGALTMNNATCTLANYVATATDIYCFDRDYCYFGFSPWIQEESLAGITIDALPSDVPSTPSSGVSHGMASSPLGRLMSYFLHIGAYDAAFASKHAQPTTWIMPSCAAQAAYFDLADLQETMCPADQEALAPAPTYLCSFWACMA